MEYQLVAQFQFHASTNIDQYIRLEDAIVANVGSSAIVDGHDIGSGEFNIFILTNKPDMTFGTVKVVAESMGVEQRMRIAYRHAEEEQFTVLWPADLDRFEIV